jgi:GTP-binding protein LepA
MAADDQGAGRLTPERVACQHDPGAIGGGTGRMRRPLRTSLPVGQVDPGDGDPAVTQFLGDPAEDDRVVVTTGAVGEHHDRGGVTVGPMQRSDHTLGLPLVHAHAPNTSADTRRLVVHMPAHEKLEASSSCMQGVSSIPRLSDTTFTDPAKIRNFCIIAHIDHGKSTLADRMLQVTGVVEGRDMRAQYLDRMDIERERGITIKAQNVRLPWNVDGTDYVMHLIDTPGHVDFTYEVSRALEACEGAVLLVDAAQGIEAQTLANLYLALDKDLTIIPVLNKIDLPAADPDRYAAEIAHIIGCEPDDVLRVSGKTGVGVTELLDEVVRLIPAPIGNSDAPARAMIFDSVYDTYRGVVTYVRVVDGKIVPREKIKMMSTGTTHELLEVGIVSPDPKPSKGLGVGEVGYLITGVKDVRQSKVGDTITLARNGATEPLTGYREPRPMVYSGLYPVDGSDYPVLREALDKLQLNDAALAYEPETSVALGFGFRCGFLGLLHMEISRERLEREFGLNLISTAPNVVYRVEMDDGTEHIVTNPSDWPDGKARNIFEPIVKTTVIAPSEFVGSIMELCQSRRGELGGMDYLSETRVELRYTLPMAEIIFDFFDSLKSRTRGYASLDYEEAGEQVSSLVKVDILLQGEAVDAFSAIVHKDGAAAYATKMTTKLKELIPRQQFEVPIQAAIGAKIIARENIRAIRKDVLAKCYGGDISRKRKLLEKQKEGKKRMKTIGRVEVPQEAFVAALSSDASSDKPKGK